MRRRIPGVERRTLRILALALVACGGEARSASAATVAATPEVVASLRADLVTLIERDAQKLENVCNATDETSVWRHAHGRLKVTATGVRIRVFTRLSRQESRALRG